MCFGLTFDKRAEHHDTVVRTSSCFVFERSLVRSSVQRPNFISAYNERLLFLQADCGIISSTVLGLPGCDSR